MVLIDHLFEAEEPLQLILPQIRKRGIEGDAVEPSEKAGVTLESINGLEGLDKGFLSQVGSILPIRGQIVDHRVDAFPVFQDQGIEGIHVATLDLAYDDKILICLLPPFGRRNQRLGDGLGEAHGLHFCFKLHASLALSRLHRQNWVNFNDFAG